MPLSANHALSTSYGTPQAFVLYKESVPRLFTPNFKTLRPYALYLTPYTMHRTPEDEPRDFDLSSKH